MELEARSGYSTTVVYSLCGPETGCCPVVELSEGHVIIGEEGNRVLLKREEWNRLVEAIKKGELKEI